MSKLQTRVTRVHVTPDDIDNERAFSIGIDDEGAGEFLVIRGFSLEHGALAMKNEGVSKGFPDLFLPVPTSQYHGLFIEMKRQKGGRVSPEQKQWLEYLQGAGYLAVVCKGFEEAKGVITDYLEKEKPLPRR